MIKELSRFYLRMEQKIACLCGREYVEERIDDTHNSGGLDRIVTRYCAVTGKIKGEKIYLSPQARRLIAREIEQF